MPPGRDHVRRWSGGAGRGVHRADRRDGGRRRRGGSAVAGGLAAVSRRDRQPAASVSTVGAVAWTAFAVALAAVTTVMSRRRCAARSGCGPGCSSRAAVLVAVRARDHRPRVRHRWPARLRLAAARPDRDLRLARLRQVEPRRVRGPARRLCRRDRRADGHLDQRDGPDGVLAAVVLAGDDAARRAARPGHHRPGGPVEPRSRGAGRRASPSSPRSWSGRRPGT